MWLSGTCGGLVGSFFFRIHSDTASTVGTHTTSETSALGLCFLSQTMNACIVC